MKHRDPELGPENLRAYQWRALKFVIDNLCCALFLDLGLGKTIAVLSAVKHFFYKKKLTKPVLLIAPLRVIKSVWRQEALKWSHTRKLTFSLVHGSAKQRMQALARPAHVYLVNPEGIKWVIEYYNRLARGNSDRFKVLWPFEMLVVDECFSGDTLVLTPSGKVRIDSLAEGAEVTTPVGPRKVKAVRSHMAATVKLHTQQGEQIACTPDHPFFTPYGWQCAGDLHGREVISHSNLSDMQQSIRETSNAARGAISERQASCLFEILRSELDVGNDAARTRTAGTSKILIKYDGSPDLEQRQTLGRSHQAKTVRDWEGPKGRVQQDQRRQWPWHVARRGLSSPAPEARVYMELPSSVGEEAKRLSYALQDRLREPHEDGSDRSGWPIASLSTSAGSQERSQASRTGVDGISHIERGSVQEVWNIEVEGCPHFFVGESELLVHNCTMFKSGATQRFKAIKKVLPLCQRRVILTGTPAPNSLMQLWSQMFIVDLGARLGTTFTGFRDRFFQQADYMGYSYELREGAKEYIDNLLRKVVLRLEDKDWLDLPPLVKAYINVDLPPAAMDMYEKFEKEMFLELDTAEVEAMHAASLTNRCHQIANGAIYALDKETADKDWYPLHDAKLEAVKEYIEEIGNERAIIAYTFKHDLARLQSILPDVPVLTPKNTERIVDEWVEGKHQFVFAHPQSAGHGINNLQVNCRRVLFYSIPWSGEAYVQLIGRVGPARRTGERDATIVHHVVANRTVDHAIIEALERKSTTQRALLDALKTYRANRQTMVEDADEATPEPVPFG